MKKLIFTTICVSLLISVKGQDIFKVPDFTVEQKHNSMVSTFWTHLAPGISFAKTHNISPYEYGAFYGKLFAGSRASGRASSGNDASFKNYAQGLLNSWSKFTRGDSKSVIEKESDSLLIFKIPSGSLFEKYGGEGRWGVTSDDLFQMMNGSHEQISKDYGCTTKMVLEEEWIVVTIKKNE